MAPQLHVGSFYAPAAFRTYTMEKPKPYCTRYVSFKAEDAERLLREADNDDSLIISTPPVKPKGGDVFIYSSKGKESSKGKSLKKHIHNIYNKTMNVPL